MQKNRNLRRQNPTSATRKIPASCRRARIRLRKLPRNRFQPAIRLPGFRKRPNRRKRGLLLPSATNQREQSAGIIASRRVTLLEIARTERLHTCNRVCHDDGMRSAACLAALFLCLASVSGAHMRAADLADCAGVVVDENGVPIVAAKITLQNSSGPNYHAETDGAGRFLVQNIPAGDYKVEVRKEGFFVLANEPRRPR